MGDAPVDLAPIRGTDDTLNTLVFIRCRHPLALDMIPSNSQDTHMYFCVYVRVVAPWCAGTVGRAVRLSKVGLSGGERGDGGA